MKECMYYLLSITKEGAAQNKCPVSCSLVVYMMLVIHFSVFILTLSNYL